MKKYFILVLLIGSLLSSCTTPKNVLNDRKINNYDKAKIVHDLALSKLGDSIPQNDSKHNYPLFFAKKLLYTSDSLLKIRDYTVAQDSVNTLNLDNYYYLTMLEIELYKTNHNLTSTIDSNFKYFKNNLSKLKKHDQKYDSAQKYLKIIVGEIHRSQDKGNKSQVTGLTGTNLLNCAFKNLPYVSIFYDLKDIWLYKDDLKLLKEFGLKSDKGKMIIKKLEKKILPKVAHRILGNVIYVYDVINCLYPDKK